MTKQKLPYILINLDKMIYGHQDSSPEASNQVLKGGLKNNEENINEFDDDDFIDEFFNFCNGTRKS
jgi:hypothetical protein